MKIWETIILVILVLMTVQGVVAYSGTTYWYTGGYVSVTPTAISLNGDGVCTATNGLCNGSGNFTSWTLATSDTGGTQTMTDGSLLNLTGGTNITVTRSGATVTISSTGGGGGSGDIEGVTAGTGLTGGGTTGTVTLNLNSTFTGNYSNWNTAYGWGDHSTKSYAVNSSAQCSATDQVTNVTLINGSLSVTCTSQGSGGGMTSWVASNGTTTETVTDGEQINFTAGTGIRVEQATKQFTIINTVTDTDTTYTNSGTLLNLSDTTFSIGEGTLTDSKGCIFTAGTGLVCNSDFLTSYTETDPFWAANYTLVGLLADNEAIGGTWTMDDSTLCTAKNGLCNQSVSGFLTEWVLAAGDTAGSEAITNGTTVNITGAAGGYITVTRSSGVIAINATAHTVDTYNTSAQMVAAVNNTDINVLGNAATATALAANGGNCGAGEYPLGVDASGAVESCTDATTEINSEIGNVLDGTDAFTDFNGNDIIDSDNYNADSIDDEHINWGTGAGQVSTDDITEGSANLYQLTEDEVEAYIFDDDNTAELNMSNYNITGVNCIVGTNGATWCFT